MMTTSSLVAVSWSVSVWVTWLVVICCVPTCMATSWMFDSTTRSVSKLISFMGPLFESSENSLYYNFDFNDPVRPQICICHESSAENNNFHNDCPLRFAFQNEWLFSLVITSLSTRCNMFIILGSVVSDTIVYECMFLYAGEDHSRSICIWGIPSKQDQRETGRGP